MKLLAKYRTRRLSRKLVRLIERQNQIRLALNVFDAAGVKDQLTTLFYWILDKRIEKVKTKLNKLSK